MAPSHHQNQCCLLINFEIYLRVISEEMLNPWYELENLFQILIEFNYIQDCSHMHTPGLMS